ncbi:MAG: TM1802 family CRISPR-associated protein [Halobacteriales archaeon]|nr:TM1802 family CRISPR-associated protein [Halobacteriales archaeon]
MVTNTPSTVVGTAEDPLALYTMQHTEKFPALNRVHAWQTQSLTPTTAILLQASTAFLDACRTTRHGLSIYTLPYFATITQERAALLARGLRRLMDREFDSSTQHPMAFIENVVEQHGDARDQTALRFYVLSLHNNGGDRNVYHENPNVTLYWPRKIARSYLDRLTTPFATAYSHHVRTTNSSLLNSTVIEKDIINAIVSGAYAWNTLTPPTEDRASINESTEWYTYQLLSGSSICLDWLLEEFIARLRTDRTTNPAHRLHGLTLPLQFLQLEALASAGILTATPGSSALTTPPSPMHTDTLDVTHLQRSDGSITRTAVRRYRLQHFLDNRPAFTENPERRGSFLIGVLVGQLSHHQQSSRNMQRTLRDQHHADTITPQSLTRLYHRLIDTAGMYATDVDWAGQLLFPETVDALTDTLSTINPTDWTLSHPDLQFFYALGVSYGLRTDRHTTELIETTRSTATTDHPNASPEP